jgi:nucleotide-binding universal stress UspA family protein
LIFRGRHSDLLVMGRARQTQGLAPDTLERLVLDCGRPLLLAASVAPRQLTGTIMVCWKDCANAARPVSAAAPLLGKASRVVIASVVEGEAEASAGAHDLAQQVAWYGCTTETKLIAAEGGQISDLVAAAYGSSAVRKFFFGSCTEAFIQHADRPILLMH